MNIKDIVNRDIVNLTNCENEPIHVPGSIQPHGFLIGMDHSLKIDFCSGNIENFTGLSHEQLLGKQLDKVFEGDSYQKIRHYIAHLPELSLPLQLTLGQDIFRCSIHK